jgi:hypothetical protein
MLHLEFSEGCKNLGDFWLRFLCGNGSHNFFGSWGISPRTRCWCFCSETVMDQLVRCWNTRLWKRWEMGPLQPITKKVFVGELEAKGKNNSNNSIPELLIIIQCWSPWSHNCMLQVASVQRSMNTVMTKFQLDLHFVFADPTFSTLACMPHKKEQPGKRI